MPTSTATAIRLLVLEHARKAGMGHIGSALSIADMLAALFDARDIGTGEEGDRLVLSKGHAALALYAALHVKGLLGKDDLDGYCVNGSLLGVHPSHAIPGVPLSTGSLGMGLSFAVGMALADRMQGRARRTYALLSDAECDEGSTWEAALAGGHHRLANLCMLLDYNRQQAFGFTDDVLGLEPLADKWRAFNWRVAEVDGHDAAALAKALDEAAHADAPTALLCRTCCGKGVSYMEGRIPWHYRSMNEELYRTAMDEVSQCR